MDAVDAIERRRQRYKESYPYKLFATGMHAYIAKLMWRYSYKFEQAGEHGHSRGCVLCAIFMGAMAVLSACINIGLVGDMWDKKKRRD